jgi:pimeloyl-ACP methyl ester carboxylesterase
LLGTAHHETAPLITLARPNCTAGGLLEVREGRNQKKPSAFPKNKIHMKTIASLVAIVASFAVASAGAAEAPKVIDVKVTGSGSPIILIPGLASPGAVWDDTVKHLALHHQCHVVTVAGFGGLPPVKSEHLLEDVRDQIIAYMRAQKLEKSVLLGHSLGGTVALAVGAKAPELVGRIIVADSLPFLAAVMMPGVTDAAGAKERAASMRATIEKQSPEQFAKYQLEVSIPAMVTKPEDAKRIAELCGKSDAATVGQAMNELLTTDLRAELPRITCPILVIAPLADKLQFAPRPQLETNYKSQYTNAKQVRYEFFEKAKHFVMIDDPAGFNAVLDKELGGS